MTKFIRDVSEAMQDKKTAGLVAMIGLGAIAVIGLGSALTRGRRAAIDDTAT